MFKTFYFHRMFDKRFSAETLNMLPNFTLPVQLADNCVATSSQNILVAMTECFWMHAEDFLKLKI